jgi:hypothetical protein
MAFDREKLALVTVHHTGVPFKLWLYDSPTDTPPIIDGSGYFNNAIDLLSAGDVIMIKNGFSTFFVTVNSISGGVIDVTDTSSGAVTISAIFADLGAASDLTIASPVTGFLLGATVMAQGAVATAAAAMTMRNGSSSGNVMAATPTFAVPVAGAAGGVVTTAFTSNSAVTQGQQLTLQSDGGPSASVAGFVLFYFQQKGQDSD